MIFLFLLATILAAKEKTAVVVLVFGKKFLESENWNPGLRNLRQAASTGS